MTGSEAALQATRAPDPAGAVRVLCYVNHYFGRPVGFEGRSTDGNDQHRRLMIDACLAGLRSIPGFQVSVCGIEGSALVPIDIAFPQASADPKLLVYESLAHMATRLEDFDYFVNIEDDVLLPPATFANVVEFDQASFLNEVLHPNRIERDETGHKFCVDLKAMPGWTYQRRTYQGRELRVALNPHSALLILSCDKLRYALRHIDTGYRGRFLSYEMDSALAYYLSPFSLYRPFDDLEYHTVIHLDRWAGTRAPREVPPIARRKGQRWKTVLRAITPPILLPRRGKDRRHGAGPAKAG